MAPLSSLTSRQATGIELYNQLLAGHKLRITFSSLVEARTFRSYLATVKSRQDRINVACGVIGEEEVSVLSTSFPPSSAICGKDKDKSIDEREELPIQVVFAFVGSKVKKLFSYEIIEEMEDSAEEEGKEEEGKENAG